MRSWFIATALLLAAAPALAQHQHHAPYAGLQNRPIKALSQEAVGDLQAGRGMGLALSAELNGYPGPKHVLEMAAPLRLTPAQAARTEALFQAMQREAQAKGAEVLEREAALDRLFASRTATREALAEQLPALGRAQGELRQIHLDYHLAMLEVLTPAQVAEYTRLRGYASPSHGGHGGHKH
ncbi:Spy/CpxP family protein refolding chaperone [Desertibaculum subflavum]|uniref:Spy/CpxP family protein refolding chaperone n=1 Tax=Desertibaculum subflavum TaxID=2268458 RepID=UPI000E667A0D